MQDVSGMCNMSDFGLKLMLHDHHFEQVVAHFPLRVKL